MDNVFDAAVVANFDELMIWYLTLAQFRPNVGKDHVFIVGTDVYEEILKERNGLEDELRFCCIL